MATGQTDAIWLVKSGEKVLGPYTSEEVAERLLAKEFVVIDEIASPLTRWRYIREEPVFAKAVEEARHGLLTAREDTEVQGGAFTMTGTESQTSTATATSTSAREPSVTASIVSSHGSLHGLSRLPISPSDVRDAEFEDLPSALTPVVRHYGYGDERGAAELRRTKSNRAWGTTVALVVAGVVVGGLVIKRALENGSLSRASNAPNGGLAKVLEAADRAYRLGESSKAAKAYAEADRLAPNSPQIVLRRAILMVTAQGQTVEGKRALSDLLATKGASLDPSIRADARVALAFAELVGEDSAAAKINLKAALQDSPGHVLALFNLGVANYLSKSYEEAVKQFRELIGRSDLPAARLMLARSLAAKGDTASVQAAAETLVSAANHLYDYSIEGEVLGAAYDLQAGNRRRAIARVRSALDLDPDMTEAIFHEPLMQTAELQWKSLLPLCRELNDRLKLPAARMLLAECLVKAGQAVDAQKLISDALAASSADGATTRLYHTMNAYVLHSLGRDEDARSALRLVGQASAPKLATIVLGRLCEASGDDDCAAQAWEKIQDDRPLIPLAETGLARVAFRQSRKEDGERLVAHVLSVAPRYLPAMKFNEERKRP